MLCFIQFPLLCETSKLIDSSGNLHYVKSSLSNFSTDVVKPFTEAPKWKDSICVHEPVGIYKHGLLCLTNLEVPVTNIRTCDEGYSRLVDPYVSTTFKDFRRINRMRNDNITFWNWNGVRNRTTRTYCLPTSLCTLPPLKNHYVVNLSETASKF